MDTQSTGQEVVIDPERSAAQIPRSLELLWSHRQLQEPPKLVLPKSAHIVEVVKPSESEAQLYVGGISGNARPEQYTSTADNRAKTSTATVLVLSEDTNAKRAHSGSPVRK